jgi:hypothetical protein
MTVIVFISLCPFCQDWHQFVVELIVRIVLAVKEDSKFVKGE